MMIQKVAQGYGVAIALGAFVIIFLEIVLKAWGVPAYVVPAPSQVFRALLEDRAILIIDLGTTSTEAFFGLVLGSLLGFTLGVCVAEYRLVEQALLPYLVGSNAVPIVAVAPLVALWIGSGIWSKIIVAAFLCFFPLCIATYKGLQESEPIYKDVFSVHNATRWQLLIKAKLPASSAFIAAGMKLNATYAVIGAIVAEFVGSSSGLGFGMLQATYNLASARLWAYLLTSICLGIAAYALVSAAEVYLKRRYLCN